MSSVKKGDILIRTTTKARYEVMRVLEKTELASYERYELEKIDTRRKTLINEYYLTNGSFTKEKE